MKIQLIYIEIMVQKINILVINNFGIIIMIFKLFKIYFFIFLNRKKKKRKEKKTNPNPSRRPKPAH
jgi:hypothetical protein